MSPREIPKTNGWIEVITGCMFSGKTEELLKRVDRAEMAGHSVKLFKPSIDDRHGEENIGTHNGKKRKAKIVYEVEKELFNTSSQVIAIDEANFFDEKLVEVVEQLAENGKRVIVSGTDSTFRGEPFDPLPELITKAEFVDKLTAICVKCGEPATRNQRLVDGKPAHVNDPTIVVGADERYEARCRKCHRIRDD